MEKELLENLKTNSYPILFEGIHTCGFLDHSGLAGRKKIIRMHNVEHHYYRELAAATRNLTRKLYYFTESLKLRRFEKNVRYASGIAVISPNDHSYFNNRHENVTLVPAFHPFDEMRTSPGEGDYFLYHGNLSVEENQLAVDYLLDKVMGFTDVKFVIAGMNPSEKLIRKADRLPRVKLISNPSEERMEKLINEAHCCIIPTFQDTGLKLKLLYSLFAGRHVICNSEMAANTSLESLCHVAENAEHIVNLVKKIKEREFTAQNAEERKEKLNIFTNQINGKKLIEIFESDD